MSKNSRLTSQSEQAVTTKQTIVPSIMHDVRTVLKQKGLNDRYIAEEMELFEGVESNLRALAYSRFLDLNGRTILAERIDVDLKQLQGFYDISSRYS
jgi:hypothetical protein